MPQGGHVSAPLSPQRHPRVAPFDDSHLLRASLHDPPTRRTPPPDLGRGAPESPFDLRAFVRATALFAREGLSGLLARCAVSAQDTAARVQAGALRIPENRLGRTGRYLPSHARVGAAMGWGAEVLMGAALAVNPLPAPPPSGSLFTAAPAAAAGAAPARPRRPLRAAAAAPSGHPRPPRTAPNPPPDPPLSPTPTLPRYAPFSPKVQPPRPPPQHRAPRPPCRPKPPPRARSCLQTASPTPPARAGVWRSCATWPPRRLATASFSCRCPMVPPAPRLRTSTARTCAT